jgi:ADP-heptose:LPS heptosyltransferase
MKILIVKLGASGDVVRTTPLLRVLKGEIHWLTSDLNCVMLDGICEIGRLVSWKNRETLSSEVYDLVINLEDSLEVCILLKTLKFRDLFGAYEDSGGKLTYTTNSSEWFDLSLISNFGKEKADQLKFQNRRTYQDLIFRGLSYGFTGEKYFLPRAIASDLKGDVAIAENCGSVWPMKNWAYYKELKAKLEDVGMSVNYLPMRKSILEHIGDIQNHKFLVSGDSLPMHIALGSGLKCMTIFTCTSPWEIHDYGLQKQVVSPYLGEFFYKRNFEAKATTCISLAELYEESLKQFGL